MDVTKTGKTDCKAWACFEGCLLTPAGSTRGVVNVLIAGRKLEKNLLRSIQSGFCYILIEARHVSSTFGSGSPLQERSHNACTWGRWWGISSPVLLQAGIWGCGQCLALTGSNLIALNHHIWGRREQMAHYMENFSAYCSKEAVTWPLSLGASGSAGTSNFAHPYPVCCQGISLTPRAAQCRGTSWPMCPRERLMSFARLKEGVGFIVVKSFQWTKKVS